MQVGHRAGRVFLAGVTALVMAASLLGCTADGTKPAKAPTKPGGPVVLTFSVYGSPHVIAAYTRIAADYTAETPGVTVNVRPYDDHESAMVALRRNLEAGKAPGLFQIGHSDLGWLRERDALEPVDHLLVERQVDFGDGFARTGMNAFTADSRLQCVPTEVSPLVAYINTSQINLNDLLGDSNGEYNPLRGWSVDELEEAATRASQRARKGLYIEPTLENLAPILLSGGGTVIDDEDEPTSLTLSEETTRDSLQRILEVVRNPRITYSAAEIRKRSAIQRFRNGNLGIMFGYRDLTARLREHGGINFAVLPIPRMGPQVTSARMSAMCLPKGGDNAEVAADFLAHLVSEEPMQVLASTGEFVPSNLEVVNSEAFTQPNLMPENAAVFADQVRRVKLLPDGPGWATVYAQANASLAKLFNDPVIEPLEDRLVEIDEASATTLKTLTDDATSSDSPSPEASPEND